MNTTEGRFSGFEIGGIDTTFVLFFLALEYGRAVNVVSVDGVVMGITIIMILVLPYFLPSLARRPTFANWVLGRSAVTVSAILLGVGLGETAGTLLPEGVRFLPMTFLILASMTYVLLALGITLLPYFAERVSILAVWRRLFIPPMINWAGNLLHQLQMDAIVKRVFKILFDHFAEEPAK